jgi:putative Holliday junction resolvase
MAVFLGLDYGKRRTGIAFGDDANGLAFVWGTHVEGRDGSIFTLLAQVIADKKASAIVLGLPLTADGRETEMATAARRFASLLESRLELDVVLWDERYSSAEADRWLRTASRKSPEDRDAVAAQIILQSYLDHLRASSAQEPE